MPYSYVQKLAILAAVTLGLGVMGCSHRKKAPDPMVSISGVATPHHNGAFGPDAVAYVRLADVTKDVQGKTVLQKEFKPDCCGTLPFELSLKEKHIDPDRAYAIDVRVIDNGNLVYLTHGSKRVLTQGKPNVLDVELEEPGRH